MSTTFEEVVQILRDDLGVMDQRVRSILNFADMLEREHKDATGRLAANGIVSNVSIVGSMVGHRSELEAVMNEAAAKWLEAKGARPGSYAITLVKFVTR